MSTTPATITIRPGVLADHAAALRIDEFAQTHPERAESLGRSLAAGECLVAEMGGHIAGLLVLDDRFFGFGFVSLIVVAATARRCGVALQLLEQAKLHCKSPKLFTSTSASNSAAQALFAKAGFVESGRIFNLDENDLELVFFLKLRAP